MDEQRAGEVDGMDEILPPGDTRRRDLVEVARQYEPRIDGYDVHALVGQGATSTVWRATQTSTGRAVAIKLLGITSPQARERFDREVRLAARLEHPNIARVYDSGIQHGLYYYVMELLVGEPLDQYVQSSGLSRRRVIELLRRAAQAVQHAHQQGVIHRDLKFGNVIVTPDGEPHLLDFGLARVATAGAADETITHLTQTGQVAGTPAFMSPEQAAGRTDSADVRSDIYSLGVMLYKLLTDHWPHDLSGPPHEVLARVRDQDVIRPRALRPDLDADLEAVLLKGLARNPDQRYDSAAEFARDLGNYLAGDPVAARKPTTIYFLRKRFRKHMVAASATIAVVGVAVVAALANYPLAATLAATGLLLSVTVLSWLEMRRQRDRAFKERNNVRSLLRVTEALNRQRDLAALWETILHEARVLSRADAGSLFIRDGDALRLLVPQNRTMSHQLDREAMRTRLSETTISVSEQSIVGYVALTGRTVNLPDVRRVSARLPFHHDPTVDRRSGYATRSVLAVPLTDADGRVVGVLQLLNSTDDRGSIVAFPPELEELIAAMAGQASVALRHHAKQLAATVFLSSGNTQPV